jgi:hypothetical protein
MENFQTWKQKLLQQTDGTQYTSEQLKHIIFWFSLLNTKNNC